MVYNASQEAYTGKEDFSDFVEGSAYVSGVQRDYAINASSSKMSKNCGGSRGSRGSRGAKGSVVDGEGLGFLVDNLS